MLSLLDLGVAQASSSRATMSAAASNFGGARDSLQTASAFSIAICLLVLIISSMAPTVDWVNLLGLNVITQGDAIIVVILMAGYLCINLLNGPLAGWYRAMDRTALGTFLQGNRRALDVVVSITVLASGGGAIELAAAMLCGQILSLITITLLAIRISPWSAFGLKNASWLELKSVWAPAMGSAAIPVAQVITLQGGVQILNQVVGPQTVVAFTMARTLMRLIIQLGIVANKALVPEISRLAGTGAMEEARRFTIRAALLLTSICMAGYLITIALGGNIIHWWSNGQIQSYASELALIGMHAVLNPIWFILAALLISTNRHSSIGGVYLLANIFATTGWLIFAKTINPILGASLAMAIPEVVAIIALSLKLKELSFAKNST
ncbi:hypothetical protein Y695_00528 [Hydrogenophaga sp. T4]|nr:hypothetical protein Y695_00528 [Hydrogenophaga sp. T4]